MGKTASKKSSVKATTAKPLVKPIPGNNTLGLDPEILFYKLEDGDETPEGEEAEIFVIHDSILAASKQNIVNRKFLYIDMSNHDVHASVNAVHDLTSGVFDHLEITSPMDMDQRVSYTQHILRGAVL